MFRRLLCMISLTLWPMIASASVGDYGTPEEAQAMAERAVAVYNAEGLDALLAAISDKSNPDFHDRDLYVFVSTIDGDLLGHGARPNFAGRNMIGLKDQNGKEFVRANGEMAASQGQGWVDYLWPNPQTNKVEMKSSWIVRINDTTYVGVGIYKSN